MIANSGQHINSLPLVSKTLFLQRFGAGNLRKTQLFPPCQFNALVDYPAPAAEKLIEDTEVFSLVIKHASISF